jgi:hypothetical protein
VSGLFSAVGKLFTPLVSGVERLGSAITGVGATAFTNAAAAGTAMSLGKAALGGALEGAAGVGSVLAVGSTLGSILSGVGGILTPGMFSSGGEAGSDAAGKLGAAAAGGVANAPLSPTGFAPTGATGGRQGLGGVIDMLGGKEVVGGFLKGLGDYESKQSELDAAKERDQALYDFKREQQAHTEGTYSGAGAHVAGSEGYTPDPTRRPKPYQVFARTDRPYFWTYDAKGNPVKVAVK